MKTDYTHLLLDHTPVISINTDGGADEHELGDLARENGHASLTSCLNDGHHWGSTVAEVASAITGIDVLAGPHGPYYRRGEGEEAVYSHTTDFEDIWSHDDEVCEPTGKLKNLIHTTNNAYDMTILVEGGDVIGAWDYDKDEFDAATPESILDWEATYPDETRVEDYGQVVETKTV